jgi:hypothetical protein
VGHHPSKKGSPFNEKYNLTKKQMKIGLFEVFHCLKALKNIFLGIHDSS